jgi:hydroxymethylpyrimidine pyrophosphatase-like HAD family hydrolase
MADVRAVVSDLDGTFWWGREQLHPSTLEAVRELRRRGVELLFATGRRFGSTHAGLHPHGLAGAAVLLSGSIGMDLSTGEEWHRQAFDPRSGLAVWEAFTAEGLSPVVHVSTTDIDSVIGVGCSTSAVHLGNLGDPVPSDPRTVLSEGIVVGFGICGVDPSHAPAAQRAADRLGDAAVVWTGPDHVMGGWTVMVGPPGISKVSGIQGWCDQHGIAAEQVLAVGDGSNDVEMLDWAGTSVAVVGGAAHDHGADHSIPTPQDGGWADILDLV